MSAYRCGARTFFPSVQEVDTAENRSYIGGDCNLSSQYSNEKGSRGPPGPSARAKRAKRKVRTRLFPDHVSTSSVREPLDAEILYPFSSGQYGQDVAGTLACRILCEPAFQSKAPLSRPLLNEMWPFDGFILEFMI